MRMLQGDVGSVVKTDADDDPIAVMAVLNLAKYKDAPFMTQVGGSSQYRLMA